MIFTVGDAESYEALLNKRGEGNVYKKGRTADYSGGSVYRTGAAAQIVADKYDFNVYRVNANWLQHVDSDNATEGHLLIDRPIYRYIPKEQ